MHLLGYFMDTEDTALRALMTRATDERNARNETMVQRLHDAGYPITMADLHAAFPGQTVLGRPHIAALLVQRGCIASVPDGMRGLLGRGRNFTSRATTSRWRTSPAPCARRAAACRSWRTSSSTASTMRSAPPCSPLRRTPGALGVEVHYTTYTPEQTAAAQALAERFGLAPSGGSDYHGLRKPDIAPRLRPGRAARADAWLAGLKALAGPGRV